MPGFVVDHADRDGEEQLPPVNPASGDPWDTVDGPLAEFWRAVPMAAILFLCAMLALFFMLALVGIHGQ